MVLGWQEYYVQYLAIAEYTVPKFLLLLGYIV